MAIPKKGTRIIEVNGRRFRWLVRRKPTYSQGNAWTHLTLAAELADTPASVLHVEFGFPRPDNWFRRESASVTPAVVADVIGEALSSGWRPEEPGPPFELTAPFPQDPLWQEELGLRRKGFARAQAKGPESQV
jgi:hypothetical protein